MIKVLVVDPANAARDGWHSVFGVAEDALNGNVSRIFLTGIPQSVPTSFCRQPDDWSCGPHSMAEALGQANGEEARYWLLQRGLITSAYGTEYSGIVGYLGAKGYACSYDGKAHDGEMEGAALQGIIDHLRKGYKVILCMHHSQTTYWTRGGHYICVYGIEGGADPKKEDKSFMFEMSEVRLGAVSVDAYQLQVQMRGRGIPDSGGKVLSLDGQAGLKTMSAWKEYVKRRKADGVILDPDVVDKKGWSDLFGRV